MQEQSVTDIWKCICNSVQRAMNQHNIDPETVRGIGFDATCSLTVFNEETGEPQCVTGPKFDNADGNDRNVILWLDHRPVEETKKVNATKHNLLRYVGGTMSIEMEMPKILWLKNNMPPELFAKCNFYDLGDALTKMATGQDARSFCSTVCKQGYVPVGVDGSEKGWQEDFLKEIGLEDLTKDDCRRLGGINGLVSRMSSTLHIGTILLTNARRTTSSTLLARRLPHSRKRPRTISDFPPVSLWAAVSLMLTQAGLAQSVPRSSFAATALTSLSPRTTSARHLPVLQLSPVLPPAIWR